MCGWGLSVMDDMQQFVERRVSTTVLGKLEENHFINANRMQEPESIKVLIMECVGSAFREYKTPLDPPSARITELQEEAEQIPESSGAYKYADSAFTDSLISRFDTFSPSNPTLLTAPNESADWEGSLSECFSLVDYPSMSEEYLDITDLYSRSAPQSSVPTSSIFSQRSLSMPEIMNHRHDEYQKSSL